MCAQDHSDARHMFPTHAGNHLATPTRRSVLTRMPKIACLASAGSFTRSLPTVSAVRPPTLTSPCCNTTLSNQLVTPCLDARPVLAVSNDPTSQHRRSHALVQGRWIPFCLRCGNAKERDEPPAVPSSPNAPILCNQLTTPSPDARPKLAVSNDPACKHRRSHAFVQGRWIPFCLSCGDDKKRGNTPAIASSQGTDANPTIAVGALPVLHTMQGFPFDLRRSRVEAGRLME